jgi:hypothetical protein
LTGRSRPTRNPLNHSRPRKRYRTRGGSVFPPFEELNAPRVLKGHPPRSPATLSPNLFDGARRKKVNRDPEFRPQRRRARPEFADRNFNGGAELIVTEGMTRRGRTHLARGWQHMGTVIRGDGDGLCASIFRFSFRATGFHLRNGSLRGNAT